MTILVTAANGNLGREITAQLSTTSNTIKAAVRNTDAANKVAGVNYINFDYDNADSYANALTGVDSVVLQAPPLDAQAFERLTPFIDAMKAANISRVVMVSAYGVDHNDAAPLRKIELKLINDGFDYTIVRPNFFMENFTSGFAVGPLEHDGIVLSSATDGNIAFVSIKDIAAVVVKALANSEHSQKDYTLSGPQALSHDEIAAIISKKLGKTVPHVALSHEELKAGAMQNGGLPESCADYLVMLYDIAKQGLMAGVTPDVEQVLGRAPLTFEQVFSA